MKIRHRTYVEEKPRLIFKTTFVPFKYWMLKFGVLFVPVPPAVALFEISVTQNIRGTAFAFKKPRPVNEKFVFSAVKGSVLTTSSDAEYFPVQFVVTVQLSAKIEPAKTKRTAKTKRKNFFI
jgi:hypothetical protein